MLIFSKKELLHIKKHLLGWKEYLIENGKDIKSTDILLEEFGSINKVELINALCRDVLDDYYCTYRIRDFEPEELEEISWLNKQDISVYKKLYGKVMNYYRKNNKE